MYYLNQPFIAGNEKKYLNDVIDSGWWLRGKYVKEFERQFGYNISGLSYNKAVTSGTTALTIACKSLGLEKKKVVIPKFSCFSVPEGVYHSGAELIFVDSEIETLGLDFEDLKNMWKLQQFSAVVLVHTFGYPARDTHKIAKWCIENEVILIEDCCESFGSFTQGLRTGSFGDVSVYSMRSEKMIGIGEGGMISTNNEELYKEICYWCDDARPANRIRFWAKGDGYNFNICEIQGAVGLAQVEKFEEIKAKKIQIGELYNFWLKDYSCVRPMKKFEGEEPVYWLNAVIYDGEYPSRDDLITILTEKDIEMRPGFYPADKLPAFRSNVSTQGEISYMLARNVLVFPSNVYLTDKDISYIINTFEGALHGARI